MLLAGAQGHVPQAAEVVIESPESTQATLWLPETTMVWGTITEDCFRMPVSDALVMFVDAMGLVIGSTMSSAEGRYQFRGLQPGSYGLVVVHRQHQPRALRVVATGVEPALVDVELTRRSLRFKGVVRDFDGKPFACVPVKLADGSGSELRETTDGAGQFSFCTVPLGIYSLIVGDSSAAPMRILLDRDHHDVQVILERRDRSMNRNHGTAERQLGA
ncbi:hypothetical protein AV521_45345 [Streptomyces sp. IMTB 2501]|nr:hypothetical protein AV521_45345 [Streptomyces sp. IMTB 2501]